ncbi:MATE family efflux transporter [Sphingomonas profundi]|uniref:MATE family efflux transporter n=1 Tax=Alterirhizorhabdus profundi TaxID=2681549 RepID=UPI001E5A3883|nr:MATE family efflux transporter [Sphingomonas profundi]
MRPTRHEIAAEARRILALAWPVMLTSLNWTLMQLIDVAVVGHAGTTQLGFLAAGRSLTFVTIVMGLAALSGVLVFSARADGAGDLPATGAWLRRGLLFALVLGLPCMAVLLLFAAPLLHLIGVPGAIAAGGAPVARAMAFAYPFQFVQIAASYFLEGVSRPRRVMIVNVATLPLNALLAWAWAGGHLGLPAMGAVGAVLATSLVSALGAAGMLLSVWTLPGAAVRTVRDLSPAAWAAAWRGVPALFRFGLVPAIASGLELFGFTWLIVLSTKLGAVPAAAFQTVFSLHNFAFAMALGFGSAAGVRVGNAVGAGEIAAALPRGLIAAALAVAAMALVGLVFWLFGPLLVRPFSNDPAVVRLTASLLVLMAPFMWFDGVQVVCVYALRSLGDQVAAGVNGVIAYFVVTGGVGSLLVARGFGPAALIYAFIAGVVAAALLQGGRLLVVSGRMRPG